MNPEDQQTYRVGDLTDPRDTDPTVTGWDAAMKEAKRQEEALNPWDNQAIGIWLWEDEGSRTSVEAIYFEGWVYTR